MARIEIPEGEGTEHSRIWQLAPHMGAGLRAMSKAVYEDSSLPIREREVARMRIAQLNECNVCLNTRAASAMQQGLTDELYQQVDCYRDVAEFTDVELLELTVTIGFCVGLGRAFNVLDIARDFDVNWSREPADQSSAASPR